MKTKLLLFVCMLFSFAALQAQVNSVAIVGEAAGGWPGDPGNPGPADTHQMTSADNVHWTFSGLALTTFAANGGIKFRADNLWATSWGSTAFPTGTGSLGGPNIQCIAGTYDVSFNSNTGEYAFVSSVSYPGIGVIGTAVSADGFNGPDVDMLTFDGINYTLTNYTFTAGELKFRLDNDWITSWGGSGFPSGTATTSGSGNITVPAGTYTVHFNRVTGDYSFDYIKIGILGTAVNADGFNGPDTDLITNDGVHYVLYNYTFTDGEAKFRQDDSWTVNWGNSVFPTGSGTQDGDNIQVLAGTYTVYFDRLTGEYNFGAPVVFSSLGVLGTAVTADGFAGPDVDMTTNDGITYTLNNYNFTNGELKIRENDIWDTSYGGATFPDGIAGLNGDGVNIPVTAGNYTLTFNRNTYAYTFTGTPTFPSVGIIGPAVNAGGWNVQDTNLTTTDGVIYTLLNHTYTAGECKLRQDDAWITSWGGPFPMGTSTGTNFIMIAGTFDLTFNRTTGEYSFTASGQWPSIGILGTAVNADGYNGPDTNMTTTDGITYKLDNFTFSEGTAKFRTDDSWDVNWGGLGFPDGTGVLSSPDNIPITAGTYTVTFNRFTAAYSFGGEPFASIGILGDAVPGAPFDGTDVDLTTSDGINYNLDGQDFVTGGAKFREGNSWDGLPNWGDLAFPSGFGTQDGPNIPITGNRYNVYFNRGSGFYSFSYVDISIQGSAVNGWDQADDDFGTDDGINYTLLNQALSDGELKFRQNHRWTVNWGASDFPAGTGTQDGANVVVTAGTYDISFNRLTGDYTFTEVNLGVTNPALKSVKVYPNPSLNVWNFSASTSISSVVITDVSGKTVAAKTCNSVEASVDASALPQGIYFAKVISGQNSQVLKVVRN